MPVYHHDALQTAKQTSFILGTVRPAHLINFIIPAMASTRAARRFLIVLGLTCTQARDVCYQRRPPSSNRYVTVMGGPGRPLADSDQPGRNTACNHPHYSVYPIIRPARLGASILHRIYCHESGNLKFNNSKFQVSSTMMLAPPETRAFFCSSTLCARM